MFTLSPFTKHAVVIFRLGDGRTWGEGGWGGGSCRVVKLKKRVKKKEKSLINSVYLLPMSMKHA